MLFKNMKQACQGGETIIMDLNDSDREDCLDVINYFLATKCFDVNRAYDIIYLDFKKASDEVHDKLRRDFKLRRILGWLR